MKSKKKQIEVKETRILLVDGDKLTFKINDVQFKPKVGLNFQLVQDSDRKKCVVIMDDVEYEDVDYVNLKSEKFNMSEVELEHLQDKDKSLFFNTVGNKARIITGNKL